jgi:chromosome segregation ATPase
VLEVFVDDYTRHHYPEEYAAMKNESRLVDIEMATTSLVNADGILGSKVSDLGITSREHGKRINALEFTNAKLGEPHTCREIDLWESRLKEARDTIHGLQKKMREVSGENESLRHEIYFGDHSDKARKRAKDTADRDFARNCELQKDLTCEKRAASRYRASSESKIQELENELTAVQGTAEVDFAAQNDQLRGRVTELKKSVAACVQHRIKSDARIMDLDIKLAEADKCIVKQGVKSREQSDTIVRMRARLDEANPYLGELVMKPKGRSRD